MVGQKSVDCNLKAIFLKLREHFTAVYSVLLGEGGLCHNSYQQAGQGQGEQPV